MVLYNKFWCYFITPFKTTITSGVIINIIIFCLGQYFYMNNPYGGFLEWGGTLNHHPFQIGTFHEIPSGYLLQFAMENHTSIL